MRILLVTATYLPTVNGVSYHLNTLKREFEKMGHTVYVLAPSFPNYEDQEKHILRYPSFPNPFVKKYPLGIPIIPLTKIRHLRPDIIHVHHPLIIGQFASYLAEKLGVPLFFSAHTQYEQYLNYYFPHGYQITSRFIVKDLINLASKCQKVICPSPETQKRLSLYGIKNTQVVFNGVDTKFFLPAKKLPLEKPVIIFTGRIEKEKNPLLLISMARALKDKHIDFEILIIGNGKLLPKLSNLVIKYKLENDVHLVGELPNKVLPRIYQSANMFFTPSKSEVMPISVMEALSSGLPTIVSVNSSLESIINSHNGLTIKSNPKTMAQEIANLFSDQKRLKTLSKGARTTALENSIEVCASKILDIYQGKS